MKAKSRNPRITALALAVTALVFACRFEPNTPELHFSLNATIMAENEYLLDDTTAQEHLRGGLEFLFGTPSHPSFLVTPEWVDDGFDPNGWGYNEMSDEEFDALKAGNRKAFRQQITAIETGDFEGVRHTRYADDLWAEWQALLADMPASPDDEFGEGTWREEAVYIFEGYYPTLKTSAEMYRQQCYHCHGSEGGGDGSTSRFLNPRPRDYRPGVFKFTGLNNKARPRHADLMRILSEGIYTTAMPSFRRFSDAQLSGLVDYVKLLAIRGETEILMITDFDPDEGIHFDNLKENYELVMDRWRSAGGELIVYAGQVPDSTPERIAHGRALFQSETGANCVKCHGEGGRGDGPSVNDPENSVDDWGNPIAPRDLTRGVFRFGRRPIDLYRRVYAGINGTPMPAHYDMQITEEDGTPRPLNEEDVWDLVFFVRSLSDKPMHTPPADDHDDHEEGGH
jgi:mono/diheme cytochrome c family protein